MKKSSTIVLQIVITVLGLGVLSFMLLEPQLEGRNVGATLSQIYLHDWFLLYAYVASTPFFVALFHIFKLLGLAGRNRIFSERGVRSLQIVRFCAATIICFVVVGEIIIQSGHPDERPPALFMGLLVILGSGVVAITSSVFEKILQKALDMKSENELTV